MNILDVIMIVFLLKPGTQLTQSVDFRRVSVLASCAGVDARPLAFCVGRVPGFTYQHHVMGCAVWTGNPIPNASNTFD